MVEAKTESLLAVFWDIENCGVPRGKSVTGVVRCLREKFIHSGVKEAELMCVCDISKEPTQLINKLNEAQVTVVHISNEHKNAADDKLRLCMRKFCDSHRAPVTLVLISGDVDFAADLSHMRHSHGYKIILVHNKRDNLAVKDALRITAHDVYTFDEIVATAAEKEDTLVAHRHSGKDESHWVKVTDLPQNVPTNQIKARLCSMANKSKGSLIHCTKKMAILQYSQSTWAERAAKRLHQQDVYGFKISASHMTNAGQPSSALDSDIAHSYMYYNHHINSPASLVSNLLPSQMETTAYNPYTVPLIPNDNHITLSQPSSSTIASFLNNLTDICHVPTPATPTVTEHHLQHHHVGLSGPSATTLPKCKGDGEDPPLGITLTLSISNLDSNIPSKEWASLLYRTFIQHVKVLDVKTFAHQGGALGATVSVCSKEEAYYAVSRCHNLKIGNRCIQVSMNTSNCPQALNVQRSLSLSQSSQMPDVIEIKESSDPQKGRVISLNPALRFSSPAFFSTQSLTQSTGDDRLSTPYCTIHCSPASQVLMSDLGMLPYVKVELNIFVQHVHTLLRLHGGEVPLLSFTSCYDGTFARLKPVVKGGVPLEHLISSVSGVSIKYSSIIGVKVVSKSVNPTRTHVKEPSTSHSSASPLQQQLLSMFSTEVVQLLNKMPGCQMPLSKFIPSYQHHFRRACNLMDYGFNKLQDLLDSIPYVIQILGSGTQRILYLTHRVHVRRFTLDLYRVLQAQPRHRCKVDQLSKLYLQVTGTELDITRFGLCHISDMLMNLSAHHITIIGSGDDAVLSIPTTRPPSS